MPTIKSRSAVSAPRPSTRAPKATVAKPKATVSPRRNATTKPRVQPKVIDTPKARGLAAEKPGPLVPDQVHGFNDFGEPVIRYNTKLIFQDQELLSNDRLPGSAVRWRVNHDGMFNPFWESMNNRHDPSLLRVHARFLELTDRPGLPDATKAERAQVLAMVRHQLTSPDGLDSNQLDYFPRELAIGVVKRLAIAAGVPFEDVIVSGHAQKSFRSDTLWRDTAPVSLLEFEKRPAPPWPRGSNAFGPQLQERRTDAGWKRLGQLQKLARQIETHERDGGRGDFWTWNDARANAPDARFWKVMDEMLYQGDLSFGLPRGGMGIGGGRAPQAAPAQGTPTTAPATPASPSVPSMPVYMTPWEMLRHPQFGNYVVAKRDGYNGSFTSWLYPR